ncbi:hypothetical protein [Nocardioides massiliensis]|uniref:Uncharacterized protein n=1 Tax=Nocardioides massiliensis TaxID=1325935 RepID=A0ABT9NJ09_9ACTN|nr:hypothetical protein [Nocardioides massiliensis]MDP9820402.1 hypothetical protein [Nocardioides massiliensis]
MPLTLFHTCSGHPDGHIGTFTPTRRTRLGCGCTRFDLTRCDGIRLHALDGVCPMHANDLDTQETP